MKKVEAVIPVINKIRIEKDKKTPFAGILLTDAAMAKIITDYEKKLKLQKLEVKKLKTQSGVKLKSCNKICEIRMKSERSKNIACKEDMLRQEKIITSYLSKKEPWYKSGIFSIVTGGIIAGGACAGIIATSK